MNIKCLIYHDRAVQKGLLRVRGPNSWLGFHEGGSKETCLIPNQTRAVWKAVSLEWSPEETPQSCQLIRE